MSVSEPPGQAAPALAPWPDLSALGDTNREIARRLDVSVKTIDTHRSHVMKKLGLRNNVALARYALRHGYVTLVEGGA